MKRNWKLLYCEKQSTFLYFILAVCTNQHLCWFLREMKILSLSLDRVCPKYLAYLQVLVHSKTRLKSGEQITGQNVRRLVIEITSIILARIQKFETQTMP